jgi:hypothetical protein
MSSLEGNKPGQSHLTTRPTDTEFLPSAGPKECPHLRDVDTRGMNVLGFSTPLLTWKTQKVHVCPAHTGLKELKEGTELTWFDHS